jgi:hypothetical protein
MVLPIPMGVFRVACFAAAPSIETCQLAWGGLGEPSIEAMAPSPLVGVKPLTQPAGVADVSAASSTLASVTLVLVGVRLTEHTCSGELPVLMIRPSSVVSDGVNFFFVYPQSVAFRLRGRRSETGAGERPHGVLA